jgi:hypothetical protein
LGRTATVGDSFVEMAAGESRDGDRRAAEAGNADAELTTGYARRVPR